MENDKKLETLEEELKLMKGEVKQSLASVRDYLLNMELPSSEFATILAALGGEGGNQTVTMKGSLAVPPAGGEGNEPVEEQEELAYDEPQEDSLEPESALVPEEEDLISPDEDLDTESEPPLEDELVDQNENLEPEAESLMEEVEPDEQDELLMPDSDLPIEEEQPMEHEKINAEVNQSIPKVNQLANLINWVAKAKKEIGLEQMSTFLEVYGISGHLSPELKEAILHLSDIISEQPRDVKTAETWGQEMLALHGILTGGDAPLYPLKPFWSDSDIQTGEDEVIEVEENKPKNMPLKLRLVLPDGEGNNKEFCLDLNPAVVNSES
jgi:hypothetical protein